MNHIQGLVNRLNEINTVKHIEYYEIMRSLRRLLEIAQEKEKEHITGAYFKGAVEIQYKNIDEGKSVTSWDEIEKLAEEYYNSIIE